MCGRRVRILRDGDTMTRPSDMRERIDGSEQDGSKQTSAKPYEAPQVTRVSLRPEEAVLGICKSTHSMGPGNPNPCAFGFCLNTLGS